MHVVHAPRLPDLAPAPCRTDKEADRRRDMVARLRTHAQSLAKLVQTRKAVLKDAPGDGSGSAGEGHHARETLETAERDELGLLVLQRQIIQGAHGADA